MKIGIVGATGEVGRTMVKVIEEMNINIKELHLFASKKSAGTHIKFKKNEIIVEELTEDSMKEKYDYLLFSAGSEISKKYALIAQNHGNIIIDNSSAFRQEKNIPLVIPEINYQKLKNYKGIIANPNCSTIQMLLALNKIHKQFQIKDIYVSTYQAVSGAGKKGMNELLFQQNGSKAVSHFPTIISNNVIPVIGDIEENGFTTEEMKMINETQKIFEDNSINIYPTAVRVPVLYGHSESILFKTNKKTTLNKVKELLENSENIIYTDELITPLKVESSNMTYVSRLRKMNDSFLIWVVADNVRVGAATNAVRILLKHKELNNIE
ncbi:aspartate-semialdehyde dehydrogenase [Tepiditoga spiralis]|uniref:Aspartate-semialdehyde dehydrogenase n=1 Tax=Tepiditoga spiralis TaxID=2108365 RepID=A0A7G1G9T8_9BACT|nr:aspartate-semialdehyde dehydrogenase [Tepiditoga spiralis]BBE30862.1 aspartate-semialdehyde dehydrogenase [Tepiditoga spiralis]